MSTNPYKLEIICEDGPVLAVNKPAGLISQGAPVGVESLVTLAKEYLRVTYHKPGNVYLGVPHRLDRPVSGVVVFSKNSKCAARLAEQFAQRQVTKKYLAVLEKIPPKEGILRDWIYRIPDHSQVEIVAAGHREAKEADLSYQVLDQFKGRALVEVTLGTGRMHQIRVQFGSRGWPIVGDAQYGARTPFPGSHNLEERDSPIALHARELTILHPVRYESLTLTAPIPRHWRELGLSDDWT